MLPNDVVSFEQLGPDLALFETMKEKMRTKLQIRGGKRDKLGIIFHVTLLKHML